MNLGTILKLFHVAATFALVGGVLARSIVMTRARKATDIHQTALFLQLGNFFTTKMISPGGMATFLLGIITALVQGWPLLGFLQGGKSSWVFAALVLNLLIYVNVFTNGMPRGKLIGQQIGPALGRGTITAELTAAMNNPALKMGEIFEYTALVLIISLMVLKPF
jgi:hypothetical protein